MTIIGTLVVMSIMLIIPINTEEFRVWHKHFNKEYNTHIVELICILTVFFCSIYVVGLNILQITKPMIQYLFGE